MKHPLKEKVMADEKTLKKIEEFVGNALKEAFPSFKLSDKDVVTEGTRMRCIWKVTAGVVPGQSLSEHTRRWIITSENWEKENSMPEEEFKEEFPDGKSTYMKFRDEAYEYAKGLNHPQYLNWVNVEWMWM